MPNFAVTFKEEVQRLARRELRDTAVKLQKDIAWLKRSVADHKRRIVSLERENRALVREASSRRKTTAKASPDELTKARITAKMVRGLREKLGLTQGELASLLGVSAQSVYQWEHKEGRLTLRGPTTAAIVEARKLGVRDARRRLDALD